MESTQPSRLTAIALTFMAVIWVSPFSWLILNAFNPLSTGQLEIPRVVGLDNFGLAVSGNAGRQFLNSMLIAAGTATLSVVGAIVGEISIGTKTGLGRAILEFAQRYAVFPERLYASVIGAAALGLSVFGLVSLVERIFTGRTREVVA